MTPAEVAREVTIWLGGVSILAAQVTYWVSIGIPLALGDVR